MTSTLRVNRRTTARHRPTLLSAATSACLVALSAVSLIAQDPIRSPLTLPVDTKPVFQEKAQPPATDPKKQSGTEEEGQYTPPTKEQLFRVDSEATLAERARQRRKNEGKSEIDFPEEENIRIKASLEKRKFDQMKATVVASYVVHQPLYFQQINNERYGWELGIFQPLVSTAQFYGDVLLFPYKFAAMPPWHCDANVGYALPGDPEPLRFLTTPFSWRGVIGEAGVAVGGAAIFP